jgi:short-subunit dehydrogenase
MSEKKTILITGASRGIGEQLALHYASPEVNLILVARDLCTLTKVAQCCEKQGANTIYESIDVTEAAEIKQFIRDVDSKISVDLVIANAGISSTLKPNWQPETEVDINQVFATNIQGTLNTINPLIDRMMVRRRGQIALMSSLAGLRGLPQSPSYCASKAALQIYGQSLRAWLARYQIQVSVICPGYIKTNMSDKLTGPKPFLISSEKAVQFIYKGLQKNKACIAFPWPLYALTKLAAFLPTKRIDAILNQFESYICESNIE